MKRRSSVIRWASKSTVYLNSDLLVERLRKSQGTIVSLIKKGDDELWPIFDRLEEELMNLEERKSRLSRYSKA